MPVRSGIQGFSRRPPTARPLPPHAPAPVAGPEEHLHVPGARFDCTVVLILGVLLTAFTVPSFGLSSTIARHAAIGIGLTLIVTTLLDLRDGLSNLLRADLLGVAAFYLLTLLEFLFPQPHFDSEVDSVQVHAGLQVLWVAFISLAIGRHLLRPKRQPFGPFLTQAIEPRQLILFFAICAGLGFLHMFLAENFNVVQLVNDMMGPRFTQPWGRGRLGDWKALVAELGLLIQLLPPIAGMVLARLGRYRPAQYLPVFVVTAFTFFYGFTTGTRNLFDSYLVTFAMGYALALSAERKHRLLPMLVFIAVILLGSTWVMVQFRNMGFKNWVQATDRTPANSYQRTLAVDYNLVTVSRLADYFPRKAEYLGGEIVWMAIVRPIPRVLWPGKPVDMSVTIEDVLGMSGLTISATYAGEAYMAGGFVAVVLFSLFLGAVAGWWNSLASSRNSEMGILVYSSGFFAAVITMRSSFEFTTAILPTVAGLVAVRYFVKFTAAGVQRLVAIARPAAPERPLPLRARKARTIAQPPTP